MLIAYHKRVVLDDLDIAHGGISIFVKKTNKCHRAFCKKIVLNVTLRSTITYCNIYIPTSTTAPHPLDLEHISAPLPKLFVIVRDCNSHDYL